MDALICTDLTKRYGSAAALNKVNIEVPTRGIFTLIGRNGAGKTTLTRILATELMPSSGSAKINGLDVVEDARLLREEIAILPQEARAIPWLTPRQSILSYLLYRGMGIGEANRRIARVLGQLGIKKHADTLTRMLSGGMKRKVLLATVLASEARILFVDEPTTGLDPISRAELWDVLNVIKKDCFIFLTTHYLEEAERLADRIGILDEGKLMGLGTIDELRSAIGYQYSVRVPRGEKVGKPSRGYVVRGSDGSAQIITTEDEANSIAKGLIGRKVRFSINPVSLEDIFYYYVKKPIGNEEEDDEW